MKKIIISVLGFMFVLTMAAPTSAALPGNISLINGSVGYNAYTTTQRNAQINAVSTKKMCSYSWNVASTYVIAFKLDPDTVTTYPHDAVLTQTGSSVSGTGGNPVGGPHTYTWHVTSGTVTGNTVNLNIVYDTGATGTVMTMTGTIAPDGSMSGTWTDNFGGTRTGTWSTTSGVAAKTFLSGCTGNGIFSYTDADKNFYIVNIKYITTNGNQGWLAGKVLWGNVGMGSWLFAKVLDGGTPGVGVDQVWGSFTTEAIAKLGVATMTNPTDEPFTVLSGNLQVL